MYLRTLMKSQQGQAIVEMALVLPIIILLLMGIFEMGRVGNAYLTVTHAARHGARYGAVGGSNTEITDKVMQAAPTLDQSKVAVTIEPLIRSAGGDITVTVAYPIELITPVLSGIVSNPVLVKSAVVMRLE
ncbi:MAG: pilus assembly protein [Dethiobacter sp.]|nr:pilus assembly protein [Dethiobacter sp.]